MESEEEIKKFTAYLSKTVTLEDENAKSIGDYLQIFKRRKYTVVYVALITLVIVVIGLSVKTNTYKSTAKVAIIRQQIPLDIIESTITSSAEERIEVIKRDFMVGKKLLPLIKKFKVYPVEGVEPYELIQKFKENFKTKFDTKKIIIKGKKKQVTLSFKVSFQHSDPETARQITKLVADRYLRENLRLRTEGAKATTDFLRKSSEKFKKELSNIDTEFEGYKEENNESLPELATININALAKIEMELVLLNSTELSLKTQQRALKSKLASTNRFVVSSDDKENKNKSLDELKAEQKQLLTKIKPKHPDAKALQRQIDSFVAQSATSSTKSREYQEIEDQITVFNAEIASLEMQKKARNKKLKEIKENIKKSYQVGLNYNKFLRERESREAKYKELSLQEMDAKSSQKLEKDKKAEIFSYLKKANLPDLPEGMPWYIMLIVGFFASIPLGLVGGYLHEIKDGKLRSDKSLTILTDTYPLVVIPYIKNLDDANKTRKELINFSVITSVIVLLTTISCFFLLED